jgi:hypothetical protein
MLALATPLAARAVVAFTRTPRAVRCIGEQQVQMGRFVRTYFRGQTVAINDIGAVSWYGDARIVDLVGLATPAVARARMMDTFTTAFIDRLCASEHVSVALLYEQWFAGDRALPPAWRRVARWTIRDPIVVGGPTVTIFAPSAAAEPRVRAVVRAFADSLPPDVTQQAW